MRKAIIYFFILLISPGLFPKSVKDSKHNLSSGSAVSSIKTQDTSMICIFCHTPHSTQPLFAPLWNRDEGAPSYTLYSSSTLYSTLGQPDGASKLCLSCHDGTIAIGHIKSRTTDFTMQNTTSGKFPAGHSSNLSPDISDDHPVSFNSSGIVTASSEFVHPGVNDSVKYDKSGKIQCTSCHDPHNDDFPKFMVKNGINSSICKSCHKPTGYAGISTHDISGGTWNGSGANPWPHTTYSTVGENSCQNCHRSHSAGGKERLRSSSLDSEVCLICHNGNTGINIKSEITKAYSHNAIIYNNIHDANENIMSAAKHTQCVDCHNPHRLNSNSASAPNVNGRLLGVSGMNINGVIINESQYEYEVCLKCHGQNRYNNPPVNRLYQNSNIRVAFLPSNASFHSVASQGTVSQVPSLKSGWTVTSRMYCSDCHNNNNSTSNGGSGPDGPHGSNKNYLLEREYVIATSLPYVQSNYNICWKCHRPGVIFNKDLTRFKEHKKHIDGEDTPCSVCHDPHGSTQYKGLLNFDTSVVFPNENGDLKWDISGNKGRCFMRCHNKEHKPKDYDR